MKVNAKQKKVLLIWLSAIAAAILIWFSFGGEIFTKTQVLMETNDEIFGGTKAWKNQFVLGLDYTLGFIGMVTIITVFIMWRLKTKR
ncbi:MAG: hypothetical protein Q8N03_10485 [Ignavibacteria bacterium]|nr:hypothetical protein [Ignavibacteria bacterium]